MPAPIHTVQARIHTVQAPIRTVQARIHTVQAPIRTGQAPIHTVQADIHRSVAADWCCATASRSRICGSAASFCGWETKSAR
ncbi:MAG: hypothetical protein MUF01_04850 [Bryobacterales bacterium]|nr:hypothetical protein [Bryobacterales bacterium]